MFKLNKKKVLFFIFLIFTTVVHAKTPLDYISEIDGKRDDLRRQLKDPNGVIKPLSHEVSAYIAGQRGLNYERKMTSAERETTLKSILRTAIIHSRFKEASFAEYFGEIKSGQRDLYYKHVAHVSIAYNAAQCLVENQAPIDLKNLSERVFNNRKHLDIFKTQASLQVEFTQDYIAQFLSEQFIKWYVDLSLGFPDITNQFVFGDQFQRLLRKTKEDDSYYERLAHYESFPSIAANFCDDSLSCYGAAQSYEADDFNRIKILGFCYEIAEVIGLHGLVCPTHYIREDKIEAVFQPFQIHGSRYLYSGNSNDDKEDIILKGIVTNPDHLSKILTFWFLTQQADLKYYAWKTISSDQVLLIEVVNSMGREDIKDAKIPFPFGKKKEVLRFGQCTRFPDTVFLSDLMQRIRNLHEWDFTRIFKKYNISETTKKGFVARLKFFKECMVKHVGKPIHEMFIDLWNHSVFGEQFKMVDQPEDSIPKKSVKELFQLFITPQEEPEAQSQSSQKSGNFQPSSFGVGSVKPSHPSLREASGTAIDDKEKERRRKLMADAAENRKLKEANA